MSANNNYTSIDYLIDKKNNDSTSSSYQKESEPIQKKLETLKDKNIETATVKEIVEHELEEELKPYLKTTKETIKLPPDLKKMGVETIPTTKFPSYQTIVLPISDEKVYRGLHYPIYSSLRWLAEFCLYLLKHAHLTIKKIKGKVVRIVKTN